MRTCRRRFFGGIWRVGATCFLLGFAACGENEMILASYPLDSVEALIRDTATAEVVEVEGGRALRLEGLILVPEIELADVGVEVEIYAEQASYPGVVFRFSEATDYELAYAVPHASGQPDAIQYDPIFGGSNTWQLHSGPAYQQTARVPMKEWFVLRLEARDDRAFVWVNDQEPLIVEHLSHDIHRGQVGLWSFRPAHFRNLKVYRPRTREKLVGVAPKAPPNTIAEWHLEGTGAVVCEPNGVLNLNRFLVPSPDEVRLSRRFEVHRAGEVELGVGFSDSLVLRMDGVLLFEGLNEFKGFDGLADRGWVEVGPEPVRARVEAGEHELEATLRMTEPFGWGHIITMTGPDLRLLPISESE